MDYAMGAMGILLGGEQSLYGDWDVSNIVAGGDPGGPAVKAAAVAFLAAAVANVASLPSGDSLKDFITQLDGYIGAL
jgi:hypothetical protein